MLYTKLHVCPQFGPRKGKIVNWLASFFFFVIFFFIDIVLIHLFTVIDFNFIILAPLLFFCCGLFCL